MILKSNKLLFLIMALILVLFAGCATKKGHPTLIINSIQMPAEAQAEVFSQYDKSGKHSMTVYWYYVCDYQKTIRARNDKETIIERSPINLNLSKALPPETKLIGIYIFVDNPEFLKFKITKDIGIMNSKGEVTNATAVVYEGIRNYFDVVLDGPVDSDGRFKITARIKLVGNNKTSLSSDEIGTIAYAISHSGKSDSDQFNRNHTKIKKGGAKTDS